MRRFSSSTILKDHSSTLNFCRISNTTIRSVYYHCGCGSKWRNLSRRVTSKSQNSPLSQQLLGIDTKIQVKVVNRNARTYTSTSPPDSIGAKSIVIDKFREDPYVNGVLHREHETLVASELQAEEDAILYERQAALEERESWQAQVDDAPQHSDYVPAASWDGVEMVGGETEWDNGETFQSFLPSKKLGTSEEITAATYRAIVEIFALLSVGKPLQLAEKHEVGSLLNETTDVRIGVVDNNPDEGDISIKLEYPNQKTERIVLERAIGNLDGDKETDEEASTQEVFDNQCRAIAGFDSSGVDGRSMQSGYKIEVLRQNIASWGTSWHKISIVDPKIKLALIKRITKVTGIPIADPIIHRSNTVSALLSQITTAKVPRSLYEVLENKDDLQALGNVQLLRRRHTPVDKERQIGRWKVIERELRSRNLPVLG